MAEKQLIVVVEGTAAMGPYWNSILSDYLEKIIRTFCGNDSGQKLAATKAEFSLVVFNAHGSYSACLVQRSGWTRNVDLFLQWLSALSFTGGGFSDVAIAEGLAEALTMFPVALSGSGTQNVDVNKHCILVTASNPYPLPTPVYQPQIPKVEQGENAEASTESCLADAETVAKSFPKCSFSLSVVSPKQLPKLRAIYNAGKRNPRAAEPTVDNIKNPYFLVLLSESFTEARNALSRTGVTNISSNQSPIKMDTSVPPVCGAPPTLISPANGAHMNRQSVSTGNLPAATVKVEPNTIPSLVPGPAFPHLPSVSNAAPQTIPTLHTSSPSSTSQEVTTNGESVHEVKPVVNVNMNILNNLSSVRSASLTGASSMGLPTMGGAPVAMHMSNVISSGMVSSALPTAQNVFSSAQSVIMSVGGGSGALVGSSQIAQSTTLGTFASDPQPLNNIQGAVSMGQPVSGMNQGNISGSQTGQNGIAINQNIMNGLGPSITSGSGTMIPTPGMSQQIQGGMQPIGVTNTSTANMSLPHQAQGAMQSAPANYVKFWEGALSGQKQGQPIFITKLVGYRSASASETLAADWPPMMKIVRLIKEDHMHSKQCIGKADFLVFRAVIQHGFLGQLKEKKLCAVIQLPSQTLLLSVSNKASRLIGMLFPADMVVFKPKISSQQQHPQLQQQQQQHQQLQQQQSPQHQQLQQQQHQQIVGALMGQGYVQGQNRSQLISQAQFPSQNQPNMPGGGFFLS